LLTHLQRSVGGAGAYPGGNYPLDFVLPWQTSLEKLICSATNKNR
jgi:hypothetical protein